MKLKKLLTVSLAAALCIGTVATVSAAPLDSAWYAEQNPDVVAEFGSSSEAMQQHYDMFGRKEGRMANSNDAEAQLRRLFNVEEYAAFYPDVQAAFAGDEEAMFQHYLAFGVLEARRPSEKVSQAAANTLKAAITAALEKAGIAAVPGSAEVVAVITGIASADNAETAQAMAEVEKAVAAAAAPAPAASSSSSSSSSSNSNTSSNTPADDVSGNDPEKPETPTTPEEPAVPTTDSERYDAMMALQEKYPEGTPWTNDNFYEWKGGIYSGGYGCAGFAFMLSDAAFGDAPARKHNDIMNIRVGDILRLGNDTHSVIVLEVTDTSVTVAEGNYNGKVHWGREIQKEQFHNSMEMTITYILTRYED